MSRLLLLAVAALFAASVTAVPASASHAIDAIQGAGTASHRNSAGDCGTAVVHFAYELFLHRGVVTIVGDCGTTSPPHPLDGDLSGGVGSYVMACTGTHNGLIECFGPNGSYLSFDPDGSFYFTMGGAGDLEADGQLLRIACC